MAASVCRTYQGATRRGLQMCMLSGMLAMSVGGADNKKPHLFYILVCCHVGARCSRLYTLYMCMCIPTVW